MRRLLGFLVVALSLPLLVPGAAEARPGSHSPRWSERDTPSTESLRGLRRSTDGSPGWPAAAVVSGARPTAGAAGRTSRRRAPPGCCSATSRPRARAARACWRSATATRRGSTRTDDGGRQLAARVRQRRPGAFYDCMDFFAGGRRGLALSDPVDGKFRIAATDDWGRSWHVLPNGRHAAGGRGRVRVRRQRHLPGDQRRRDAWFATGGGASRVFHSRDGGLTWTVDRRADPRAPRPAACSRSRSATRARA